jgi:hypothetical protein
MTLLSSLRRVCATGSQNPVARKRANFVLSVAHPVAQKSTDVGADSLSSVSRRRDENKDKYRYVPTNLCLL